ncbi:GGDEF domain-containing protein [Vibrio harveyi]|uniref:GGDEF domain-containing protein n=1 Tax=Vibrio harveyi TaxID=669 RepID=UPI0023801193|nr:GGDEF domain-containing protein [Vibrio harveyi]WDZ71912.1 GGDEF domain-containing protein [Vibrio harveyi]
MSDNEPIIFPWNHNFETGMKKIDEQHYHLFLLVNKLANTLIYDDQIEVDGVFSELKDYAQYHFSYEESVWNEYFSDDIWNDEHKKSHASFVDEVIKIQAESKDLNWQESIEHILQFLVRWLVFHIIGDDKKMSVAVRELESSDSLETAKVNAVDTLQGINGLVADTVLKMYFEVSSQSIELVREKHRRFVAEKELRCLNKKLQELAITDELSGLYNRRYFNIMTPDILNKAQDTNQLVSFVSIDLDYFKQLNDQFGHLKGDEAITKVGALLSAHFNDLDDIVFRIGGEEFLVVIVGSEHKTSINRAEAFRKATAELSIICETSAQSHILTSSIGVFTQCPEPNLDIRYYLDKADQCLYKAKLNGRNIVIADEI